MIGVGRKIKILSCFLFVAEVWKLIFSFILCSFSLNKILIQAKVNFIFFSEGLSLFFVYFILFFFWIWNSFLILQMIIKHSKIILSILNAKRNWWYKILKKIFLEYESIPCTILFWNCDYFNNSLWNALLWLILEIYTFA